MIRKALAAIVMAGTLTACVSLPMGPASLALLDYALDTAPEILQRHADQGDARAQYALSLVYRFGLNGMPRSLYLSHNYRLKALAQRGYTPITQYIAGLNGAPGRTAIINVARYDISAFEAQANDACASALHRHDTSPSAVEVCGGEASHADLREKWSRAEAPNPLPVLP